MFQIFEFLLMSLVREETSFPHSVTSRERVKIHAHFPHGCGTHFTIPTCTLWLKGKTHQGDRETSVENTSRLSAVSYFSFVDLVDSLSFCCCCCCCGRRRRRRRRRRRE